MKNIYTNRYSEKNSVNLAVSSRLQIMRKIIDGLNLVNQNILDIGCYDGALLSLVKNQNNNLYGLDASQWAVAKCRQKNIQAQNFFWDDSAPLPYGDNFFDLVIAGEIIEHIFDTEYFLAEIRRVLKTDGKLLLSTPNVASLGRRLLLFLGKNPLTEISVAPGNAGHIRYFTFKALKELLIKHHFQIVQKFSDIINFSNTSNLNSKLLAKIFPNLSQSIIYLAKR